MAKLIYLSPSAHGVGANKCRHTGCYEDKHTRPMAEACAKYLKSSGFEVIVADANKRLTARCSEANSKGADLYVPIHTNACSVESARYLLFMCISTWGEYKKIFDAIKPFMEKVYSGSVMLSKRTDLYEINVPKAKTLYCEMGFHTNNYDCDHFIHNADAVGKALAQGICSYYGVTFKDPAVKTPKVYTGTFPTLPARGYLHEGDKGVQVLRLQKFLNWFGANLAEDSIFGPATKKAVEAFQRAVGIIVDGLFGRDSLAMAKKATKDKRRYTGTFPTLPSRGYLQQEDKGVQVLRLQKFLNWWKPELKLAEDSEFGPATKKAVEVFQKAVGITVDGLFGRDSLAKAKTITR